MRFLPVFFDLTSGTVTLLGSGDAALNKLRLLCAARANVCWFPGADSTQAAEVALASAGATPGQVEIVLGDFGDDDLTRSMVVVSAAGDPLDGEISRRARAVGIPVNVVDRTELSSFVFPAIVDRGDVVVAIGTGGASPVVARRLRERIEAILPARIGDLVALLGRYRSRFIANKRGRSPRDFWQQVVDGPIGEAALAGRLGEAEQRLAQAIDAPSNAPERERVAPGTVHLVGAGPGDADLLTLRALQVLQDADVVFHDELVSAGVLDRIRREAKRVPVGKRRGAPGIGQAAINRQMVEAARAGKRVVRLKGGDPLVFGRGGEEVAYLREAGVPVVVVPGITAALGCAAEAELPLTYRNEATQLTVLTAHRADEARAIDWSRHTDPQATLVVYMGLASAAAVRDGLIAAGRDGATPAAVLARGTWPDARSAVGRLDQLAVLAASAGPGPAVLVIGDVVRHSRPWRAEFDALVARTGAAA